MSAAAQAGRRPRVAAVVGGSTCTAGETGLAAEIGSGLAQGGFTVVTGGLGGVMEAASRGAKTAGGLVVAVLPGDDRTLANPFADVVVCTGIGHARNLAVVATADVVVAVGGEWGTLAEIGLARKLGRPVVLADGWQLDHERFPAEGVHSAHDAEDAVRLARKLAGKP